MPFRRKKVCHDFCQRSSGLNRKGENITNLKYTRHEKINVKADTTNIYKFGITKKLQSYSLKLHFENHKFIFMLYDL